MYFLREETPILGVLFSLYDYLKKIFWKNSYIFSGTPVTRSFVLTLSIGVTFGFTFAYMFLNSTNFTKIEFSG